MERVFVDANILFSIILRDLFIELVRAGAIEVIWSEDVQIEWARSAVSNGNLKPLSQTSVDRQNDCMNKMLPDAYLPRSRYEHLIESITGLNDQDDRHVVAAAIIGNASILSSNDKKAGFNKVLGQYGITLFTPDDFMIYLINDLDMIDLVTKAIKRQRSDYTRPLISALDLVDAFSKNGLVEFAKIMHSQAKYL
ncbi:PIN domain-containing protein [Actimicrobium sp. CCI2.3]|uniref:PIN domain-containing protein n=1 Tax=Actimicrobium sp. CCI2.3 TaxID=3048616 RepID=UPI002AB4354D|nr:PIN domain-containing protein [Actimicrobium sp. CCI2.3]MDY7576214.1 PIN domain-containing protein [Actimicrobium sp. CCI2.3]MEB0020581.1 PIN domain-containing protein [Actimicrobium sp. CCI2.3]